MTHTATFRDWVSAHEALTKLAPWIKARTIAGRPVTLTVSEEPRSSTQNRAMWAALTDISRQVEWYGQKMSPEDWKHVFTAALIKQRAVPGIDGGFVVLGAHTSTMSKSQMSELLDLIHAFGNERGVLWSDAAQLKDSNHGGADSSDDAVIAPEET